MERIQICEFLLIHSTTKYKENMEPIFSSKPLIYSSQNFQNVLISALKEVRYWSRDDEIAVGSFLMWTCTPPQPLKSQKLVIFSRCH